MRKFTTGLIAGAIITAGIAIVANPINKRDMRRIRSTSRRAIRGINRRIHRWT